MESFVLKKRREVACYDTYGFFSFVEEKRGCVEEEWGEEMDLDEIPKTKSSQELTR